MRKLLILILILCSIGLYSQPLAQPKTYIQMRNTSTNFGNTFQKGQLVLDTNLHKLYELRQSVISTQKLSDVSYQDLVPNTTAQWNANQLQGRAIATTAPISGNVLSWNGSSWTPSVAASTSIRYWSDTTTVTRVSDSTITLSFSTSAAAFQFSNFAINHVVRWKKWNGAIGTDSNKCAMIQTAVAAATNVDVTLIGDYFLATDRATSVSYTNYDKVQFYEWFVTGLQVADTNPVGMRRSWDTLKYIRIIASAGRLGTKGTGTIKFAYNLYIGGSPLGGYSIMETNRNYNFDGYLKRTNRPINARRLVPGGYWVTLKTPIASGTTVPSDLYVKLWWIEAKLLDAQ